MSNENQSWSQIEDNKPSAKKDTIGNAGQQNKPVRRKVDFVKLSSAPSHHFRPLGMFKSFDKFFVTENGKVRSAVSGDSSIVDLMKQKHNLDPQKRFAINVIDRSDGKLKVLEGPASVFRGFKEYNEKTKRNPGGSKEGADFEIDVAKKMTQNGERTFYTSKEEKRTPLTDAEKEMVSKNIYDLDEVFKETPKDKVEAFLFGRPLQQQLSQPSIIDEGNAVDDNTIDTDLNF